MRAVRYHTIDPACDVRLEDVPTPAPGAGEVLVRVRYASLNPVDWKIATGSFRPLVRGGRPRTMGSDFAGEIVALGNGVESLRVGERVWGFVDPFAQPAGTFAEYCALPATHAFPLADAIVLRDAAALACVGATAVKLCELGCVTRGSNVLVNGASGGVGHVAVQVAKARGARVTAVASGGRREFLRALGADDFIDHRESQLDSWPGGFSAVFDCVPNLPRRTHPRLLDAGGHYVSTIPGAATFLLDPLANRLGRVRRHAVMLTPNAAAMRELGGLAVEGRLRCHIEDEFALEDVAAAIARSRSGRVQGKIVIRVG
jgi:NADPH:quinone reductase-like Zn-dependent oxidoreductase